MGGPLEYLNERNSILFDDIEGLERALMGHTNQDYIEMKERCIKDAMRFDIQEATRRIKDKIRSVLKEFYE
ncbi:MAG: hypothetical protein JW939_03725 [Candidatus Thermoplasmatota archaeon]|nr:hypothetical protein [Candidatus Thermoplasmatota archaeon]